MRIRAGWVWAAWVMSAIFVNGAASAAIIVAHDDASDPAYTAGGPYHLLNGGFGFGPWQTNGFPFGGNSNLHEIVATSTINGPGGPDIDTAGVAWGNNADPTGNTFAARRSLLTDLQVGGTYAISYDGGDVDGQETIGWGLGGNAICQFYFNASVASGNYQFYDTLSNTTIDTGILQTFGGLRLTLARDTASTYRFTAVRLSDSATFSVGPFNYDTSIITGIRAINVTNADGGAGGGHQMFVNSIEATMVPEPVALSGYGAALVTALSRRRPRRSY